MTYIQIGNNPQMFLSPISGSGYITTDVPEPDPGVGRLWVGSSATIDINTGIYTPLRRSASPLPSGLPTSTPYLTGIGATLYGFGIVGSLGTTTRETFVYTVDKATGSQIEVSRRRRSQYTEQEQSTVFSDPNFTGLTSMGNTLYAVKTGGSIWAINIETAEITLTTYGFPTDQFGWSGIASIGTKFYGTRNRNDDDLHVIDTLTGEVTEIGPLSGFGVRESMPDGLTAVGNTLYMIGNENHALYRMNPETGLATRVSHVENFGIPPRSGDIPIFSTLAYALD